MKANDMQFNVVTQTKNIKTGNIMVTYTDMNSCPSICPLKNSGCYAELGHVGLAWRKHSNKSFDHFQEIVSGYSGEIWRHNVAGDLPGDGEDLCEDSVKTIANLNKTSRGFTYTHYDVIGNRENRKIIKESNNKSFTINLSGNSIDHAVTLHNLGVSPVVTIVPEDAPKKFTVNGIRFVVCPATYREDVTCKTCKLCAVHTRESVVCFPVHGSAKGKANKVFMMAKG